MKIKNYKNFNINKKNLGKGLTIVVEDQKFIYDHDEVYAFALNNMENNEFSVLRNDGYSTTKGFPKWASKFIKAI